MKPKTDFTIDQVIVLARDYMERKGLRQKDFASRIGYSNATLQMFLAGTYKSMGGSGTTGARLRARA